MSHTTGATWGPHTPRPVHRFFPSVTIAPPHESSDLGPIAAREFVYDVGYLTPAPSWQFQGVTGSPSALWPAVVAAGQAWPAGASDEVIAEHFLAWHLAGGILAGSSGTVLDEPTPIEEWSEAPKSSAVKKNVPYHQPRAMIATIRGGVKLCAVSAWVRGHVGQMGRHWSRDVLVYDVATGEYQHPSEEVLSALGPNWQNVSWSERAVRD